MTSLSLTDFRTNQELIPRPDAEAICEAVARANMRFVCLAGRRLPSRASKSSRAPQRRTFGMETRGGTSWNRAVPAFSTICPESVSGGLAPHTMESAIPRPDAEAICEAVARANMRFVCLAGRRLPSRASKSSRAPQRRTFGMETRGGTSWNRAVPAFSTICPESVSGGLVRTPWRAHAASCRPRDRPRRPRNDLAFVLTFPISA